MSEQQTEKPGQKLKMMALTGQWDELQDAWIESVDGPLDPGEALDTVNALVKRGESDRARILAQTAVGPFNRRKLHAEVVAMARIVAGVKGPEDQEIPDLVISSFQEIYSSRPEAGGLLRKALVYRGQGLKVLLDSIDSMFRFSQGDIVHHKGGWGYGRITRISGRTEQVTVEFEGGKTNDFQILSAGEYLRRIKPDSYEGLKFASPQKLAALAKDDPLSLLKLLLESRDGRMQVKAVKEELGTGPVPQDSWPSWWTGAKEALKHEPLIELESGSHPSIRILDKPMTYGDAKLKDLEGVPGIGEGVRKARAYLSESRGNVDPGIVRRMFDRLIDEAGKNPATSPGDLAGLWFLAETARDKGYGPIDLPFRLEEVISGRSAFIAAMESLSVVADQGRLIDFVIKARPAEWPEWVEQVYFLSESSVWEKITKTLVESGNAAKAEAALARLAANPKKYPLGFLWMFKSSLAGKFEGLKAPSDVLGMTEKALILTNKGRMESELPPGVEMGKVYTKAKDILTEKHFRDLFGVIGAMGTRRLIDFISGSGLRPTFAETIEQIGISKYPEIVTKSAGEASEESRYIYISAEGLRIKRAEYERLLTVDVEENRIALGKAIAMGDLSENAELDAAREMQRQISKKANDLEKALDRAKVIDFSKVGHEKVEIGAGVEVLDQEGRRSRFLLLGPWDVDPDKGVISYAAALGEAFLNRKAGDSVSVKLPDGEKLYTIEKILKVTDFDVHVS